LEVKLNFVKIFLQRAAENLAVAIALAPANEHAYNQLGVVRDEQQRPSEAVAAFDAALVLRPGWDKASQNREGVMARKVSR
jgi:lipoprotein NlpI